MLLIVKIPFDRTRLLLTWRAILMVAFIIV